MGITSAIAALVEPEKYVLNGGGDRLPKSVI